MIEFPILKTAKAVPCDQSLIANNYSLGQNSDSWTNVFDDWYLQTVHTSRPKARITLRNLGAFRAPKTEKQQRKN